MPLSDTTTLKCKACGSVYPRTYTPAEHADREHCDGPLQFYCDACKKFVPDTACETCEKKAQAAAEAKRKREARQSEIAAKIKATERQIHAARSSALSAVASKKCRECGGTFQSSYISEQHHDNEHCDGTLSFFCEYCRRFQSGPICVTCEQRASEAERLRQEREEIERRAAEQRKQLRREREERARLAREQEERRQKTFRRVVMVPGVVVLVASTLCFLLTTQLITHGEIFLPYTAEILFSLLGIGIIATFSIFAIAAFFDLFVGP
jgi:cation transport ATPase